MKLIKKKYPEMVKRKDYENATNYVKRLDKNALETAKIREHNKECFENRRYLAILAVPAIFMIAVYALVLIKLKSLN